MRQIIILTTLSLTILLNCEAEVKCKIITLGQFVEKIQIINFSAYEPLIYRKYSSFNFNEFKPLNEIDEAVQGCFFRIGFNSKNEIKEIIYRGPDIMGYYLKIHDFQSYRILIPVADVNDCKDECGYYGTAILMDKLNTFNYLISTHLPLGESSWGISVSEGGVDIKKLEDLSTIMVLDENLYPITLLKILKGRVVFSSKIKYRQDHVVDYGQASLFFSPGLHKDLEINFDSCPETIVANCESPEMIIEMKPKEFDKQVGPLWNLIGEW